jgi:hypothetical protein
MPMRRGQNLGGMANAITLAQFIMILLGSMLKGWNKGVRKTS